MTDLDLTRGLNPAEKDAMRQALAELAGQTGFAFDQVFDALAEGQSLLEALHLPKEVTDLLYAMAFARFNAGDVGTAQSLFLALTLIAPEIRDHWLGLGICLRRLQEYETAQSAFLKAEAIAPDDPAVLFHLTELTCQLRNWSVAQGYLNRFVALPETAARLRLIPEMRKLALAIEAQQQSQAKGRR
ncbi:hypothetical protein [Phaeobacter sp. HF9A]|uniref:hypothetical protein n=1 Tax=Phaeobacter sp. HF9A TaxID=2721561 RepID=UPI001430EB7B|nr:hypothetical protein [Phaeobacter sp. HF9A]NIZ12018.1 hypothetical protein [Phaeobacter sp. HF9A]